MVFDLPSSVMRETYPQRSVVSLFLWMLLYPFCKEGRSRDQSYSSRPGLASYMYSSSVFIESNVADASVQGLPYSESPLEHECDECFISNLTCSCYNSLCFFAANYVRFGQFVPLDASSYPHNFFGKRSCKRLEF